MKIRKAEEKDIPRLLALLGHDFVMGIGSLIPQMSKPRDPPGYFYSRHHQIHCLRTCRAFEAGG